MAHDLELIGKSVIDKATNLKLNMPSDYSAYNAMAAAYLNIREKVTNFDKCTAGSIANALFTMVVLGLNPIKQQCYFVAYGDQLTLLRSYMGSQALAKRVNPNIAHIRAKAIYEGDEIEIETVDCLDVIKKHVPVKFSQMNRLDIIGAYAVVIDKNNQIIDTVIMTMEDIKESWKMGSQKGVILDDGNINPNKTHGKFTASMCKRTVINKICKPIINTSDDMTLLKATIQSDEDMKVIDIVQPEIEENANKKMIDFKDDDYVKKSTKDQARRIFDIAKKLNITDKVMYEISGYFDSKIEKISQLTFDQANEFAGYLSEQIKEAGESKEEEPDWS